MVSEFKPLLAADVKGDLSRVQFPVYVSAKIDGIRAMVRDGKLVSRSLKPIPNKAIRAALERPEFEGFDGELIVGEGIDFQATTSKVMSINGDTEGVEFWVFDLCNRPADLGFSERLGLIRSLFARPSIVDQTECPVIVDYVPQNFCTDAESVLKLETEFLAQGFEGAMIRAPHGPYKHGRSTVNEGTLLKLKRFEDAEATVIGTLEEMQNLNEAMINELGHTKRASNAEGKVGKNTLGALVVQREGVTFKIGCGWTAEQRYTLWRKREDLIGKVVKFKHLPHGAKDAPRHPVFLGFRAAEDIST